MRRFIILLMLLQFVSAAKVMIYADNLDTSCYHLKINNLRDFLQASGYTVEFGNKINESEIDMAGYDAIILLSCTRELTNDEINALLNFVDYGGGLLIDAYNGQRNVLDALNISVGVPITGLDKGYNNSFGQIIGRRITYFEQNEMTARGENELYFEGNTLILSKKFKPLFWNSIPNEVVAGYSELGNGRIVVSGSLFSFKDNLFLDILDWAVNQSIFPLVEVSRKLSKQKLRVGETLLETITVTVSGGKASVDIYEEIPPEYGIVLTPLESSVQDVTNLKYVTNQWNATKPINGTLTIPPVKVTAHQGARMRIFYSEPVNITIEGKISNESNDQTLIYILGIVALFLIIFAAILIFKRKSKVKPISKKEELLKEKKILEKELKMAKIKFMKREITQEMYNDIVKEINKRLIEINVKLEEM